MAIKQTATKSFTQRYTILDAADATGAGTAIDVESYRHVMIKVHGDNSANLTVKCQGSIEEDEPSDWTATQSTSGTYDYILMYALQNAAAVNGDDGVIFTGTEDTALYTVNTDRLKWLNFTVTARTAGDVTVTALACDNK